MLTEVNVPAGSASTSEPVRLVMICAEPSSAISAVAVRTDVPSSFRSPWTHAVPKSS